MGEDGANTGKKKNFTFQEKETFKMLIKQEPVIYSSQTEGCTQNSTKMKTEAWNRVVNKFNNISGHSKRDVKQLKKLWDNLKNERKKKIAAAKQATMKTGGGVIEREKTLNEDPLIDVLLDQAVDVEHSNAIDSDTVCLAVGTSENYVPANVFQLDSLTRNTEDFIPRSNSSTPKSARVIASTTGDASAATASTSKTSIENITVITPPSNISSRSNYVSDDDEDDDPVVTAVNLLTKKRSKGKGSQFDGIFALQKKQMEKEHELRMIAIEEDIAAKKAMKEYYISKKKEKYLHLFNHCMRELVSP